MSELTPNDASVLALMAQYPSISPGQLRVLKRLLGPEGKRIATAMVRRKPYATISAKRSDAALTASGLKKWASGNRYSVLKTTTKHSGDK
jgi:hypothetical protein